MIVSVSTAELSGPRPDHAGDDRRWMIAFVALALYCLVYTALPMDKVVLRTAVSAAGDVAALLMIVAGVRRYRPSRPKAWLLIAGLMGAWAIADSIWGIYQAGGHDPFPSPADLFYLVGYGFLFAGLVAAVRARSPVFDVRTVFDPAIVTTGAAFLAWVYVAAPVIRDAETSGWEAFVTVSYVLADVLVLSITARLMADLRRAEI